MARTNNIRDNRSTAAVAAGQEVNGDSIDQDALDDLQDALDDGDSTESDDQDDSESDADSAEPDSTDSGNTEPDSTDSGNTEPTVTAVPAKTPSAQLFDLKTAVENAIKSDATDPTTGTIAEADMAPIAAAWVAMKPATRSQAGDWMATAMGAALTGGDLTGAQSIAMIKGRLDLLTPVTPRVLVDPYSLLTDRVIALRAAVALLSQPVLASASMDGLTDDDKIRSAWQAGNEADLGPVVNGIVKIMVAKAKGEEAPDYTPVQRAAMRLAQRGATGSARAAGTSTGERAERRDLVAHLSQVGETLTVGQPIKLSALAAIKSDVYPDGAKGSANAIRNRFFSGTAKAGDLTIADEEDYGDATLVGRLINGAPYVERVA